MSNIINGIAKDLKSIPEKLKAKTGNIDKKKLVLMNLPYVLAGYFCDKVACLWRVSPGRDASAKMMAVMEGMEGLFSNPLPSFYPRDLLIGVCCGIALRLAVYFKSKNAKKFRKGVEYGSARWGNEKDIEPYMDSVFENNILLTQTERLMMSGRPKQPKYARNKNVLVIGGSGSGKTRFFVKPNLMQMHSSYVITDPKGSLIIECGKMLEKGVPVTDERGKPVMGKDGKPLYEPYKIKVLNTINFKKSMHYNPFVYLRSEKDILKLVNTLIANTKGEGAQAAEDFWVKAERLYYTALIGYIWYECVEDEQNFGTLIDMVNASEVREEDENYKNAVDLMFEELEGREPGHFAVRQYVIQAAGGKITDSASINVQGTLAVMANGQLGAMGIGELIGLGMETMVVSTGMKIMSVLITVILYGRMIEIYLYISVSPIPFATFTNREWGSIGTNYFKGLVAMAFQGFFIMVCVAIYSALVSGISVAGDLHSALWQISAYTVILCFSLFKTGGLSRSIFNTH